MIYEPNKSQFLKMTQNEPKTLEKTVKTLKAAFLEETAILFENYEVKIGMKCSIPQNLGNEEKETGNQNCGLMILLYYCNKNRSRLEGCSVKFDYVKSKIYSFLFWFLKKKISIFFYFIYFFIKDLEKIKVFPSVFEFSIDGNTTKRQDFYIQNYDVEDEIVNVNFHYKY